MAKARADGIDEADNKWLDSTVNAYVGNFGFVLKPVVWEVGSRDGIDAVGLAKRIYDIDRGRRRFWHNAKLVCIEANPEQAAVIKKEYPKAKVLELAITDVVGVAPFKVYHGNQGTVGSSSLKLDWKDGVEGHTITVKTERLDNLIGDEVIDIMKIDVEGFSEAVLRGLGDKVGRVKVFHIETETWSKSNNRIKLFMTERGYFLADERQQYGGMPDQVWVNGDMARDSMRERLADYLEPDQ